MENYKYSVEVSLSKPHDRGVEATKLMVAIGDAIHSVLGESESGTITIHSPTPKQDWIPFNELVNPDDSFKPCPNCGQKKIRTGVSGSAFTPSISNRECGSCGCWFKPEEKDSRKGFKIVVS